TLSRLTDESKLGISLGANPRVVLGPSDDAALMELKQQFQSSGSGNGLSTGLAMGLLDPPQANGELGSLGLYRMQRILGRGGTGIVFKATDADQHEVAVKVLKPELSDRWNRARFLRGAHSVVAVESPHVVKVVTVADPPEGLPYLVMEYIAGGTLHERIT